MSDHLYMQVLRDSENLSLPPKPVDPDGLYVSWILVTSAPGLWYEGQWIEVDGAWLDNQVRMWGVLTSDGYEPGIIAEHDPRVTKGERLGHLIDLRRHPVRGQDSLIAAGAWSDEDAEDKIKRKKIRYVSPGFKSFEDDRGIDFTFVLGELSITTSPHQKRLGGSHILASEGAPMNPNADQTPDAQSVEDRLVVQERKLDDLIAAVAKLMAPPEPEDLEEEVVLVEDPKEEEDDDNPSPAEAKMAERLKTLETALEVEKSQRRRAEFDAAFPVGAVITLSESVRDEYFAFSEKAPKAYAKVAKSSKVPDPGTPAALPRRNEAIQWGASMSEGSTGRGGETDDQCMARLTQECGGDKSAAVDRFLAERLQS